MGRIIYTGRNTSGQRRIQPPNNSVNQPTKSERENYNNAIKDQQAYQKAYNAWKKGISWYWYKDQPKVQQYLKQLWQDNGSYNGIEKDYKENTQIIKDFASKEGIDYAKAKEVLTKPKGQDDYWISKGYNPVSTKEGVQYIKYDTTQATKIDSPKNIYSLGSYDNYGNRNNRYNNRSNINANSNSGSNIKGIQSYFEESQEGIEKTQERAKKAQYEGDSKFIRYVGATERLPLAITKGAFINTPLGIIKFAKHPIDSSLSLIKFAGSPNEWKTVKNNVVENAKADPINFGGELAGELASGYVIGSAGTKIIGEAKNVVTSTGSKYIPEQSVWDTEVLKGESTFPKARNTKEIEEAFKKSENIGSHATTNKFNKETTVGGTRRIEDKGLYMSSWGRGSPYFTGVTEESGYKFSLNPLKNFGKNPSLIKVNFKNLAKVPQNIQEEFKKIYNTEGKENAYNYINNWYDKNAKPQTAYIPMRSEMGETPELQALLPKGTEIKSISNGNVISKLKGYEEYTSYKGKNIPIREYNIVGKGEGLNVKKILNKYEDPEKYYANKYDVPQDYIKPYGSYKNTSELYDPYYQTPPRGTYSPYNYGENYSGYSPYGGDYGVYQGGYDGVTTQTPSSYGRYGSYYRGYGQGREPPYSIGIKGRAKPRNNRILPSQEQGVTAWQPIILRDGQPYIYGDYFRTSAQAESEGSIAVDELPETEFTIRKVQVPRSTIKEGRKYNNVNQFRREGLIWKERKPYQNNRPKEGGFNWMTLMTPNR